MTTARAVSIPQDTHRNLTSLLAVGVLGVLICAAPTSRADGGDAQRPEEVIEAINRHIAAGALDSGGSASADATRRLELMAQATAPHTDFHHMARLVLEDGWERATPGQQQRFVSAFRAFLLWTFYRHAADNPGARTVVLSTAPNASDRVAVVKGVMRSGGGGRLSLVYRLRRVDNRWKLFDVSIDGLSLITLYRNTFARPLAMRGLDGLIEVLNTRNQSQRDA